LRIYLNPSKKWAPKELKWLNLYVITKQVEWTYTMIRVWLVPHMVKISFRYLLIVIVIRHSSFVKELATYLYKIDIHHMLFAFFQGKVLAKPHWLGSKEQELFCKLQKVYLISKISRNTLLRILISTSHRKLAKDRMHSSHSRFLIYF
jgi:hypothetical protein